MTSGGLFCCILLLSSFHISQLCKKSQLLQLLLYLYHSTAEFNIQRIIIWFHLFILKFCIKINASCFKSTCSNDHQHIGLDVINLLCFSVPDLNTRPDKKTAPWSICLLEQRNFHRRTITDTCPRASSWTENIWRLVQQRNSVTIWSRVQTARLRERYNITIYLHGKRVPGFHSKISSVTYCTCMHICIFVHLLQECSIKFVWAYKCKLQAFNLNYFQLLFCNHFHVFLCWDVLHVFFKYIAILRVTWHGSCLF